MKYEELKKRVGELKWFQRLELPTDEGMTIITPFQATHCIEEIATKCYGIPENLTGLTVLDIGCNDGFHSFFAEKRGAKVAAIDPNQGGGDNIKCFMLAKEALNSNVTFVSVDLMQLISGAMEYKKRGIIPYVDSNTEKQTGSSVGDFDVVFYFGVLYHVISPIDELKMLFKVTKQYALIETAIAQNDYGNRSVWEFNNGFDNDPTNYFYPSLIGLKNVLKYVGFSKVELIWTDGIRASVKAIK